MLIASQAQKLVLTLVTSLLTTMVSIEDNFRTFTPTANDSTLSLQSVLWIYYLVWFKKNQAKIQALIDFDSEINVITPAYIIKLGFKIYITNVEVQKIDYSTFAIFKIILTSF